jgi:hypothetical protein
MQNKPLHSTPSQIPQSIQTLISWIQDPAELCSIFRHRHHPRILPSVTRHGVACRFQWDQTHDSRTSMTSCSSLKNVRPQRSRFLPLPFLRAGCACCRVFNSRAAIVAGPMRRAIDLVDVTPDTKDSLLSAAPDFLVRRLAAGKSLVWGRERVSFPERLETVTSSPFSAFLFATCSRPWAAKGPFGRTAMSASFFAGDSGFLFVFRFA